MKKLTFLAISFILCHARAQGTLELSDLAQTPVGSAPIANDAWVAQSFFTGFNSSGYILNSIQILMGALAGNPGGFTVSIYSSSNNSPGSAPISNLGSLNGLNPLGAGIYSYSTPGIYLAANTLYQIVVTDGTPSASGSYAWSATTEIPPANNQWNFNDVFFTSSDGLTWTSDRGADFQMALYATPVPEPSTWALAGIGAVVLSLRRRKQNMA